MSLFDRFFGSRKGTAPGKSPGNLERQLKDLESQAREAPLGTRGTLLNRAGDVCLKAGDRGRALRYFGEAIDTLLADEQGETARGVARKIIRVHPEAVRTLCTLTWLDLSVRQNAAAVQHLKEYVRAVKRSGREDMATGPILEMARTVRDDDFLREAAKALDELGASRDAGRVRQWGEAGGSPEAPDGDHELSGLCFRNAAGSNALRRAEGAVA